MTELRIGILVAGLILLAAIWYFGTRPRKGQGRKRTGDGFEWELDVALRCGAETHVWTVDPNSTIRCATGATLLSGGPLSNRSTLNLSEQLRVLPPNDELFAPAYGRRNDSESGNKNAKSDFDLGHRARSYTRQRHETDLWIYALLANALVWKEHAQLRRPSATSVAA